MKLSLSAARVRAARWCALLLGASLAFGAFETASAAMLVSKRLTDVPADQRVTVAHPQPVQLLFQFNTKGKPNARATKYAAPAVMEAVKASGLFSEVSDKPVANGAILSVAIDNVVDPEEMKAATAKGAMTGVTLGLAGSTVRDHYLGSVDYVAGPSATTITRSAKHDLVMQMGLIKAEATDAVKVDGGLKGAIFTMVRQIVSNPLNAVAADPAFAAAGEVTVPATFNPAAGTGEIVPEAAPVPTPVADPAPAAAPGSAPAAAQPVAAAS